MNEYPFCINRIYKNAKAGRASAQPVDRLYSVGYVQTVVCAQRFVIQHVGHAARNRGALYVAVRGMYAIFRQAVSLAIAVVNAVAVPLLPNIMPSADVRYISGIAMLIADRAAV